MTRGSEPRPRRRRGDGGPGPRLGAFVLGHGPAARVWGLALALLAIGVAVALVAGRGDGPPAPGLAVPWWAFALAVGVIEFPLIQLHIRSEAHAFTLGELGLCAGLFLLPPGQFVIGAVVGASIAKFRLPPARFALSAALWTLEAAVAAAIFHRFADHGDPFGGRSVVVAVIAMALVGAIGVCVVFCANALERGHLAGRPVRTAAMIALAVNVASAGLGIVAAYLATHKPQLVLALVGPVAVMFLAIRAFIAEHQQHQRLRVVAQAARSVLRAPEIGAAIDAVLAQAREVFHADVAQIVLYPDRAGEQIVVRTAGPGADGDSQTVPGLSGTLYESIALTRRAELVSPEEIGGRGFLVGLDSAALGDVIVAPLESERRVVGAIAVANRIGDAAPFDDSDVQLLETLAGHAGVAIGNGRLERTLEDLRELQGELALRATQDPLTGLANREHFALCLESALADADRRAVGLVYIDLDDFKLVNDRHGHATGDLMLREVAGRLSSCLRGHDVAGRLGGDEFAVLLRGVSGAEQLSRLAERIRSAVEHPIACGGIVLEPRVSFGVTLASAETSSESLLSDGDTAMYYAKRAGKGRSAVYDLAMRDAHTTRAELISALSGAVDAGELVLHYQPIVSLPDRRVVGVEALVRWDRPGWGVLAPAAFVPLAEEAGLATSIGQWVLEEACGQVARWNLGGVGEGTLRVSVNVSPEQLTDAGFDRRVAEAVHASRLDPSLLTLEITEAVLEDESPAVTARLDALRGIGVQVALDDFGTGLSSLARLGDAPVDVLKIPGAFLRSDVDTDRPGLADALVTIGRTLGLPTVAESVETDDQVSRLVRIGCRYAQGHVFAPAMPAPEFEAWIRGGAAVAIGSGSVHRGAGLGARH